VITLSIISCIGNTPLLELKNINVNPEVKIFGKLEGSNPGASDTTGNGIARLICML